MANDPRIPDTGDQNLDAAGPIEATPSQLKPLSRPARIEAVLRELIWRMDHVRTSFDSATIVDRKQLLAMLDTTDALAALNAQDAKAES